MQCDRVFWLSTVQPNNHGVPDSEGHGLRNHVSQGTLSLSLTNVIPRCGMALQDFPRLFKKYSLKVGDSQKEEA